jgi:hypothetical protein
VRVNFVQLIEVCEYSPVLGQGVSRSAHSKIRGYIVAVEAGVVIHLVGAGHEKKPLTVACEV